VCFVPCIQAAAQNAVEGVLAELMRTEQQLKGVQHDYEEVRACVCACVCV